MGKSRMKIWRQSSRINHIIGDRSTSISQYNQRWMMTWVTSNHNNTIHLFEFSRESQYIIIIGKDIFTSFLYKNADDEIYLSTCNFKVLPKHNKRAGTIFGT